MIFLEVPPGRYRLGTSEAGVEAAVQSWRRRLINPCYSEEKFRSWIEKEYPDHWVETQGFDLSQTLVSNGEAKLFIKATGSAEPESIRENEPENHPVWGVSHEWAMQYASWMSQNGEHYRLPTEQEWEIAARGSDFREYPYGSEFLEAAANTVESGIGHTTPVDHYRQYPGHFGHFDLAGNVEEWVSTMYSVYDGGRVIEDNLFESFGMNYPILRGGSFACGGDLSRTARRHGPFVDPLFRFTGFRLVRDR